MVNKISLLDVCNLANQSVQPYSGKKFYLSTGALNHTKIEDLEEYTFDNKPSRANLSVQTGDIIFARMKDTVKVLEIGNEHRDLIFSTGFAALRPNKEKITSHFLFYFLCSPYFQRQKNKLCKGATQKAINNINLKQVKIPLPPINQQKRITSVLDQTRSLIDKRKEAMGMLEELTQAIFVEMFGDPVSNRKEWNVAKIEKLVKNILSGLSLPGESRKKRENELGVLKVSSVTTGYFRPEEYKVVKKEDIKKSIIHPLKGDILFSRANTRDLVAATCIVDKDYNDLFLPDKLWKIILDTKQVNPRYFLMVLSHKGYRRTLTKKATGTSGSMLNISKAKFLDTKFPLPPIELQNEFARRIETIETQKSRMQQHLDQLQTQFDALLQRAFTGQLDLSPSEVTSC